MKKIASIFFFLFVSLKLFSQKDTSSLLAFKIDPALIYSNVEFGGLFEYHLRKRFSVEAGGGVHALFAKAEGYTIRAGVRFYSSKSSFYFNPAIFYRHTFYNNRYYQWNKDSELSEALETHPPLGFGSGTDCYYEQFADEYKQVFAIQALLGWEYLWLNKFPFEFYVGIGGRYKYRQKEITSHYYACVPSGTIYYSPPKKETIHSYLPSMQGGFQIGFPLMKRKH